MPSPGSEPVRVTSHVCANLCVVQQMPVFGFDAVQADADRTAERQLVAVQPVAVPVPEHPALPEHSEKGSTDQLVVELAPNTAVALTAQHCAEDVAEERYNSAVSYSVFVGQTLSFVVGSPQ